MEEFILKKLKEVRQYEYNDGCVLFWIDNICTPEEIQLLHKGTERSITLEGLARYLASAIKAEGFAST